VCVCVMMVVILAVTSEKWDFILMEIMQQNVADLCHYVADIPVNFCTNASSVSKESTRHEFLLELYVYSHSRFFLVTICICLC
jgi:hypothetical protein